MKNQKELLKLVQSPKAQSLAENFSGFMLVHVKYG